MLLYDFATNQRSLISAENSATHLPENYFVDRVVTHPLLELTDPHAGVAWTFEKNKITLTYQ